MGSPSSSSSSDYVELIKPQLPPKYEKSLSRCSSSANSPLEIEAFHDEERLSTSSSTSSSSSSSSDRITLTPVTKPPPSQAMEVAPNNPNPSNEPYRIPPHVFERNPSTTPVDWSVASNESLFSIPGSTSFRNESFWKFSGEFSTPGEGTNAANNPSSSRMFSYIDTKNSVCMRSQELVMAEATMKEVIQENEVHGSRERKEDEVQAPRRSHGSNASNKSFAFSIMTGDSEKARPPSSVRSRPGQHLECDDSPTATASHDQTSSECPKPSPLGSPSGNNSDKNGGDNAAAFKWFSCFGSCKLC